MGTATAVAAGTTGNAWIDPLLAGTRWSSGAAVTTVSWYLGGQAGAEWLPDGLGGTLLAQFPINEEPGAFAAAMAAVEAVCNLRFQPVAAAPDADLLWASVPSADAEGGLGWATAPGLGTPYAVAALNRQAYQSTPGPAYLAKGSYDYLTVMQVLGTALGLATPHPDDSGAGAFPGVTAWPDRGDGGANQGLYTMMSWNDGFPAGPLGLPPSPDWGFQAGPMALDIAALQHLYGVNTTHRTGNDIYDLPAANAAGTAWTCLWDAGGDDRIVGAIDRRNVIDLRAATLQAGEGTGGFASYAEGTHGGVTIAAGAVIERAVGGDLADRLSGNAGANFLNGLAGDDTLLGREGNDVLEGGLGDDRMEGGAGNDIFNVSAAGDLVVELAGEGSDEVRAAVSWTLGDHVENLTLTGAATDATGNALANKILGNAGANTLRGLAGDDRLEGGAGADSLLGGLGNDLYVVTDALDTVTELPGEGTDDLRSSVSIALPPEVENLLLSGNLAIDGTGNALDNRLTGNAAANRLLGGQGHDVLEGLAGADVLEGGAGNDIYILADALDTIAELAGEGTDELRGPVSMALGANVENAALWGAAALSATGNALANRMTGNSGANALSGGEGNDRLDGSSGNDTLDGGTGSDLVQGGRGLDTLTGGLGNDSFLFISATDGADRILDWGAVAGDDDRVQIRASGFGGGLVAGATLAESRFVARADNAAQDADDRFVFRTTDSTLWFDLDGSGAALPSLVADLQDGALLTAADLLLVT